MNFGFLFYLVLSANAHEAELLLDNWQLEDARLMAEELLVNQPDDAQHLLLAAKVQHQRGEYLSALSLAKAAFAAGLEDDSDLMSRILGSGRFYAAFETLETDHFRIRYLNKDEVVAHYAKAVLESAYAKIGRGLLLLPAERGEKIVVEIYPDARGLADATGLTVKEIDSSGTIAVCKFHRLMITSPLATADGYDWADTLAHEFTHLVISKKSQNTVPIWLHEGIAKYFESGWKGPFGQAMSPHSESLLMAAVKKNKFITFEQMHPSMAKLPTQEDAALAFAEVFTVIEYLSKTFGEDSIAKLLAELATGAELNAALKSRFGMSLNQLEKTWRRYLVTRPFKPIAGAKARTIRLSDNETKGQDERPLETIEDKETHDFARLGELLQLRNQHPAALVEYEKAYARSQLRYVTLLYRLAKAYLTVGRSDDALKLLEQTLVAHPGEGDVLILAGRIHMQRKESAKAFVLFDALRLQNPFNPELHAALQTIYTERNDPEHAALEQHFFELTSEPRKVREYSLLPPKDGATKITLITKPFCNVRIDGGELMATPMWEIPLALGEHHAELLCGPKPILKTFSVKESERLIWN